MIQKRDLGKQSTRGMIKRVCAQVSLSLFLFAPLSHCVCVSVCLSVCRCPQCPAVSFGC